MLYVWNQLWKSFPKLTLYIPTQKWSVLMYYL